MLVVLLVLTAGVSCSDDEELLAGNGIADAAWSAENQVEIEGGVLNYTFAAASDWTARSSADWCEVQTGSGMAGESLLRLKVAKNTRAEARSATITVSVWGYASPVSFVVKQGKGLIEQGDGKYRSVNEWVAEYMKSRYLWNRAIENRAATMKSFLRAMESPMQPGVPKTRSRSKAGCLITRLPPQAIGLPGVRLTGAKCKPVRVWRANRCCV